MINFIMEFIIFNLFQQLQLNMMEVYYYYFISIIIIIFLTMLNNMD